MLQGLLTTAVRIRREAADPALAKGEPNQTIYHLLQGDLTTAVRIRQEAADPALAKREPNQTI